MEETLKRFVDYKETEETHLSAATDETVDPITVEEFIGAMKFGKNKKTQAMTE
jgi:hypothetical protein